MRLFKRGRMEKNILLLGDAGSGKKSLVLSYKDGISSLERYLPDIELITYKKKLTNADGHIHLNFILDRASVALIPSADQKTYKLDLILILGDLSTEHVQDRLKFYAEFSKRHFQGIKTLMVGTKSDKQLHVAHIPDLIMTSSKTGDGLDEFDVRLEQEIGEHEQGNQCIIC